MKVAHVITRLILGGAQENTLYNCEDLIRRHGHEVLLITGPAEGPEGDLFARAQRNGVPTLLLPELVRAIRPWTDARAYKQLRAAFRRFKPDVVHTHSSKAGILGRAAAWAERVPRIIHTIHGLPFHPYERWWKNWLYIAAERWAARRCHHLISVADAMTDHAVAARIAPREKFTTIYSGMEVEPLLHPPRPRAEVRRELGLAEEDIAALKIARLFEHKGHDDVIDAAAAVVTAQPRVRFVFVGGGIWRDRLQQRIDSAGLGRHFLFTGLVPSSRIPELLGAADLVVHASYREGLARVLPQALIAARPVVSYDVDGAREVVIPEQTGYLVAAGDIAGLAQATLALANDPAQRQQFGQAGRALFTDRFRHETMTEAILRVYEGT